MDHRARQRREWPAIEEHLPPRARRASLALLETLPIIVRVTRPRRSKPGDPNCKICGGPGFWRQDLPGEHPDFGTMQICVCPQQKF